MTLASPLSAGPSPNPGPVLGGSVSEAPLSKARLWKMLGASLLVHAFLTPLPAFLGLARLLPALELGPAGEIIEVELTALPLSPVAPVPTPPPEASPAEPVAPPDEPAPEKIASEPAPGPETVDPAPEEPRAKVPPNDGGVPGPTAAFGDPVALAGSAGEIADSNANVRIVLFTDVVRSHALGAQIGQLLSRTPQWRDFFGPSKIDPIRDIDHVLIAGPQLRNSSQVVAVVQHRLDGARIDTAFEALIARNGNWLDRDKRIVQARADRADRIFAAPSSDIVVVAPPSMAAQIASLGPTIAFPKGAGDVAVTAYLVTPYRATQGIGIQLPESIKWVRLDLRPLPDGGARLKILAEDGTEEEARDHALLLETLIVQATSLDLSKLGGFGALAKLAMGSKKKQYLKSVKFSHRGNMIDGTLEATQEQMQMAVDMLDAFLPPPASKSESAFPAPDADKVPEALKEKKHLEEPSPEKKEAEPSPTPQDESSTAPPP